MKDRELWSVGSGTFFSHGEEVESGLHSLSIQRLDALIYTTGKNLSLAYFISSLVDVAEPPQQIEKKFFYNFIRLLLRLVPLCFHYFNKSSVKCDVIFRFFSFCLATFFIMAFFGKRVQENKERQSLP